MNILQNSSERLLLIVLALSQSSLEICELKGSDYTKNKLDRLFSNEQKLCSQNCIQNLSKVSERTLFKLQASFPYLLRMLRTAF